MNQESFSQIENLDQEDDEIKSEDFKNENITRGIWHSWHLIGYKAEKKTEIVILYAFILMYVKNMICEICKNHAFEYISKNIHIETILRDENLTDSEIIVYFNKWLYNFHKSANQHAGKDSPEESKVASFYLSLTTCNKNCGH